MITAGTRGERSRRVRVRDIGVFGVVKLSHNEIVIHDFPKLSEPFDLRDMCLRI